MVALSVNLNKIALIRNSRTTTIPNLITAADTVVDAGANGITVHPRPDQRHIRVDDVYQLSRFIKEKKQKNQSLEYNIEGNPLAQANDSYPGFLKLVCDTVPNQCTLVPDSDHQQTSDHGWDILKYSQQLTPIIADLKSRGIRVSLFMDTDLKQIEKAKQVGADRIEFYTGPYAQAVLGADNGHIEKIKQTYNHAAQYAKSIGLGVNAGHDLNLDNGVWISQLPGLCEVSIGHALINDALYLGLKEAVLRYKSLFN